MLRESRARLNLWLGNRLRWQRGGYRESPALQLDGVDPRQRGIIQSLQQKYGVAFEERFNRKNALENYLYLDLLDRFREKAASHWPVGGDVLDVGCKNFYYAPVLHAVFKPSQLNGIELEGYRLYPNLYSRYDYASYYISELPDTRFIVADLRRHESRADLITCFYPFVFEDTHTSWRLPASQFDPAGFFDALLRNLKPAGRLLIVNQGIDEAEATRGLCQHRAMTQLSEMVVSDPLLPRAAPPIATLWCR